MYSIDVKDKKTGTEITISRRFNDFVWLHDSLIQAHPAALIPPLPEKVLIARVSVNAPLVEYRERELERFLIRVASHPVLVSNPKFILFLNATQTDLETAKKQKPTLQAVSSTFKVFGSNTAAVLTSMISKRQPDPDPFFEHKRQYAIELEVQIKSVITTIGNMLSKWKEMASGYADYATTLKQLSQHLAETDKQMSGNYDLVQATFVAISQLLQEMISQLSVHFEDALKDWWRELLATKELLDRRDLVLSAYRDTTAKLEKVEKGKHTPQDKATAEQNVASTKTALEEFSTISKKDLEHMHSCRIEEVQHLLHGFSQLYADVHDKIACQWKEVFSRVEQGAPAMPPEIAEPVLAQQATISTETAEVPPTTFTEQLL